MLKTDYMHSADLFIPLRADFPILSNKIIHHDLVYFDNAATTHKPKCVIDAIQEYYTKHNSNVHRGVHTLSANATVLHENSRQAFARFLNTHSDEIIFTSGTTHGINLVARSLGWKKGDEIILTEQEHHSNILPWQKIRDEFGVNLKILPLNENLRPQWELLPEIITENTRLFTFVHTSNTLGNINPAKEIIRKVRSLNPHILVLLDGAQSVPHFKIDLNDIEPDFFVFSMHKAYGPTGFGVLYIQKKSQSELNAVFTGGGTIKEVTWEKTEYENGPLYFEPGTPHMEGAFASMKALEYLENIGMNRIFEHDKRLTSYAIEKIKEMEEVELYSEGEDICGAVSFNVKGQHPYDVGVLLNNYGIAVRTGHHCTQPLMKKLGIPGTVRASFALYNTISEIDYFIDKLKKCIRMLN
ncbi:MAG: cysteine desulfurase [Bacteroidia bacterium]|nr:cysteine desulfurase [Bacteroidia bacterium]